MISPFADYKAIGEAIMKTKPTNMPLTPEQIASRAITEQDGFDFLFQNSFISRRQYECATVALQERNTQCLKKQ